MSFSLTSNQVHAASLYQGGEVRGRRLLGQRLLVITGNRYNGQLAVPLWPSFSRSANRGDLRYQRLAHLYLVFRQAIEILESYGLSFQSGEKAKMMAVINAAKALNLVLAAANPSGLDKVEGILRQRRGDMILGLGRARKPVKVDALHKAGELDGLYDSLDRVNLAAKRSLTVAVGQRAQQRLWGEIAQIEPVIAARLWAAGSALDFAESTVLTCRQAILDVGRYIKKQPQLPARKREQLASRLALEISSLAAVSFQPFVGNFRLCQVELNQAMANIRDGRHKEALAYLGRAYFSLSYKETQRLIEEIILELTLAMLQGVDKRAAAGQAQGKLAKVRRQVSLIKEKGFRHPVKEQLEPFLEAAYRALAGQDLQEAKEKLKLASHAVTLD